jgi:hypothetical protein
VWPLETRQLTCSIGKLPLGEWPPLHVTSAPAVHTLSPSCREVDLAAHVAGCAACAHEVAEALADVSAESARIEDARGV